MNFDSLEKKLGHAIDNERVSIRIVIEAIAEAETTKLYAHRRYSSMFLYLTDYWKYPRDDAHRRLAAARLAREVPQALEMLDHGQINLTTMALTNSAIRAQEKATNVKLSPAAKSQIVGAIKDKSVAKVERLLFNLLPETRRQLPRERIVALDENTNKVIVCLTNEDLDVLARARDILSHAIPSGRHGHVIARVLRDFVSCSKLGKRTLGHACEFRDEKTGALCGSTFMLEKDHIVPRALGGSDDETNRRWLCKPHNLLMAEITLGPEWANCYRAQA